MLGKIFKYFPLLLPFTLSFNRIDIGYFFELKLFYLISFLILVFNLPKKIELPKYFYFYLFALVIHSLVFIFINNLFFRDLLSLNDTIRWKYKAIIVFFKLLLLQVPFFLSIKILSKKFSWKDILISYFYGVVFVSILAIIQFILFYVFGKDIFPLGFNESGEGRSGAFSIFGFLVLRVCSIAGEPRDLGLHVTLAYLLITYFPIFIPKNLSSYLKILLLTSLLLTFSTTGFSLLLIVFFIKNIYNFFILKNINFKAILNYKIVLLFISIIFFSSYIIESLKFVFQADKIENILTEDVDSLVSKFLNDNKLYFFTGVGSGNIYLHTYNINDDPNLSYVKDNVIQARYGFRRIIGDQGIFLFLLFLSYFINKLYLIIKYDLSKYKFNKLFFLFTLIIFFILRDSTFEFLILSYFIIPISTFKTNEEK